MAIFCIRNGFGDFFYTYYPAMPRQPAAPAVVDAPNRAAYVTIAFEGGFPVEVNGQRLSVSWELGRALRDQLSDLEAGRADVIEALGIERGTQQMTLAGGARIRLSPGYYDLLATTPRVASAPMPMTMMKGTTVHAISTATLSWKLAALWPTDLRCLRIE